MGTERKTLMGKVGTVGDVVEYKGANWRIVAHRTRHTLSGGSYSVTKLVWASRVGGLS